MFSSSSSARGALLLTATILEWTSLSAVAAGRILDPATFEYCNVEPKTYSIPTIAPAGLALQQVQVFIRHGDRVRASGGDCWPNDTAVYECEDLNVLLASNSHTEAVQDQVLTRVYRKAYLPGRETLPGSCGLGVLTARGYAQEVANAEVLRDAYGGWLPDFNNASDASSSFLLRSTDSLRTLQSGQALVDALFPVDQETVATKSSVQLREWHTIDAGYDSILEPYMLCPYANVRILSENIGWGLNGFLVNNFGGLYGQAQCLEYSISSL